VINELLEKKFVGEKPMTGNSALMASVSSLDLAPELIKREVSFGSLPSPSSSALTAALASANPDDPCPAAPTPRSSEGAPFLFSLISYFFLQ
jgi:hypothetical protein